MPYPPLNISRKIIHLSQGADPGEAPNIVPPAGGQDSRRAARRARDVPLIEEQEVEEGNTSEETIGPATQVPFDPPQNLTGTPTVNLNSPQSTEAETQSYWLDPTEPSPADRDEEFVNAVVSEYEDSNEPGSAMGLPSEPFVQPTKLPPILLELRWLPPRPPTSYDGFNIYIYIDGKPVFTRRQHTSTCSTSTGLNYSCQQVQVRLKVPFTAAVQHWKYYKNNFFCSKIKYGSVAFKTAIVVK